MGGRKYQLVVIFWFGKNIKAFLKVKTGSAFNFFFLNLHCKLIFCRGRCLARIVSCSLFSTYEEAVEQLEKLVINRQYADCKSALDVALTAFKSNQLDCKLLLKKLVPLLYSNRFLTRLLPVWMVRLFVFVL
jgi:hypothetical protein